MYLCLWVFSISAQMTHVRVQTPGVLCKAEFELKQLKRYEIAYTDV